jgi:hypothetical protein
MPALLVPTKCRNCKVRMRALVVMTGYDLIAIGVLIVVLPLLLRRTFLGRKSGAERNKEKPKD